MLLTVLVPTYKRPDYLANCLAGLKAQSRQADEIIITVREDDAETFSLIDRWKETLPVRTVLLDRPGVVTAMNAGCAEAQGELISLTDDDAVPRPDWLERIEQAFLADDRIGAVGGMDILRSGGDIPTSYTTNVGIVTWYGRVIGNHHAGTGPLREVDHLKGVNMSWRVTAAGRKPFATDLRGAGAQVFFEMSFCFRLAREGWKIVYDPAILVDHYVAVRFDEDARAARSVSAQENAAFNLYMSFLREHSRGWKRFAALAWARLIGFRGIPGLLRQLPAYLRNDSRGKEVAVATRRAWRDAHAVARSA